MARLTGRVGRVGRVRRVGRPDASRLALVSFAACALGVAVAGGLHGRLYHQGYDEVYVVGPLFALNVVGSAALVLLLLAGRTKLFALGALAISGGAIVSILLSHSSGSFAGFTEEGYSTTARAILVAEIAAAVLAAAGLLAARRRRPATAGGGAPRVRAVMGLLVVAATGLVLAGVSQGSPPEGASLSPEGVAASVQRVRAGNRVVQLGRRIFQEESCGNCHTVAASNSTGTLGPRLDIELKTTPRSGIQDFIRMPEIVKLPGYDNNLMPRDYVKCLTGGEIRALSSFLSAAAGG